MLLVVNHQAICHMSDDRQNNREDEQRVPDAKDWRYIALVVHVHIIIFFVQKLFNS